MLTYISDSKSIKRMENFNNLMTPDQNKAENSETWVGGEYYIQTCFFLMLKQSDIPYQIIEIDREPQSLIELKMEKAKIIILPGWTCIPDKTYFNKFYDKMYTYYYVQNINSIKLLTPYYYKTANSIGFYAIPLDISQSTINFDPNIQGTILSKCISHNINNMDFVSKLLNECSKNNIKFQTTIRDLETMDTFPVYLTDKQKYIDACNLVLNSICIKNFGIISPSNYRKLLIHSKYLLLLGNPICPPSIIEAMESKCIIIADKYQISEDLHNDPNVIIYDKNDVSFIVENILKIESGERIYIENCFPERYTVKGMEKRVKEIMNSI